MERLQCPIGANITLADLEQNFHPLLHRLRAHEPVSWIPALDSWLVTRYDLAVEIMRDAKRFTVDHPGFSTSQVVGPSMLSLDGDAHQMHRAPFERPFRKREVEAAFQDSVSLDVADLIDGFAANGEAELRRDFAGPVAVRTMITALGLGYVSTATILTWYDAIVDAVTRVTMGKPAGPRGEVALAALRDHLLPIIRGQGDSLLALASGLASGLSADKIVSNAAILLFGGVETTEGLIANTLYFLLTDGELMAQVRRQPTLIPTVVEESLRMEPSVNLVDRYATCDVQVGDALIKEGELVHVALSAANRDPAIFPEPDFFNPRRTNLRSHVTFAQGPHVCLGLHLARLEAVHAIEQIVSKLQNLRLQPSADALAAATPRGFVFRKPAALYAIWNT
ncbi:MAG: cytochrome P450 [Caldilineaceae bacterium]